MAKLSARGASELARATNEQNITGDELIFYRKEERVLRSDMKVLTRMVMKFHPDEYYPKGRHHDYGWTIRGKAKAGLTPTAWAELYRAKGWSVTLGAR